MSVTPADISTPDSGLTVIHQHLVVDVWLRWKRESLKTRLAWLTFLEHMIFKGTPSSWVFDREIENRGGMRLPAMTTPITDHGTLLGRYATHFGTALKCSNPRG